MQPSPHQTSLELNLPDPSKVAPTGPLPFSTDLRALSLTQPWATLVILPHTPEALRGEKEYETRSRRIISLLGNVLAIHASKNFPRAARELCAVEPFRSVLAAHGFTADNLPTASILGTVDLLNCEATEIVRMRVSETETDFGNYGDKRFAYRLAYPRRFSEIIPCAGFQGFWRVKEPHLRLVREAWESKRAA